MRRSGFFVSCIISILLALLVDISRAAGPAAVTVTLDSEKPGSLIPADFTGLSYEITQMLPDSKGGYYFSPTNRELIGLFRSLGIKSLRVGGNTADRDTVPIPAKADADSLFAFAKAAGVKVIYTVRLAGGDPEADAAMVKYLVDHYATDLECITLGNEPNKEFTNQVTSHDNYLAYGVELNRFIYTIATTAPGAKYCGPSVVHTSPDWTADMAADKAHDPRLDFLTQHYYCAKSGQRVTDLVAARDKILSPAQLDDYRTFYHSFMPAVTAAGLTCRFEETSSFSRGGVAGASDTFASALWAVDYLHWWAEQAGMRGFNFHMGKIYGAFVDADRGGYSVRPLSYGIKAFDLGGHGRVVPATLSGGPADLNLTAYGVRDGNVLYVTLINKEHDAGARMATVKIVPGAAFSGSEGIFLQAPHGDVSAKTNLTLGNAAISGDGRWDGYWTALANMAAGDRFKVTVPPATVLIVKFNLK